MSSSGNANSDTGSRDASTSLSSSSRTTPSSFPSSSFSSSSSSSSPPSSPSSPSQSSAASSPSSDMSSTSSSSSDRSSSSSSTASSTTSFPTSFPTSTSSSTSSTPTTTSTSLTSDTSTSTSPPYTSSDSSISTSRTSSSVSNITPYQTFNTTPLSSTSQTISPVPTSSITAVTNPTSTAREPSSVSYTPVVVTSVISAKAPGGSAITSTITSSQPANGELNVSAGGSNKSFFDNKGAVGGTFAAVGIVAALIIAAIVWLFYRRRKNQQMDADVVAAAGAAAATTRTPFDDDDDPEMIEGPTSANYHGYYNYGAQRGEYAPSTMSAGTTPGMAGMGAWGPAGVATGGGGAAAGYGAYYGSQHEHGAPHQYYEVDPNAYYGSGPTSGHDGTFTAGSHPEIYAQSTGWSGGMGSNHGYANGVQMMTSPVQHPCHLDGESMPFSASVAAGLAQQRQDSSNGGGGGMSHEGAYGGLLSKDGRSGGANAPLMNPHSEQENLLGPNVFSDPSPPEVRSSNQEVLSAPTTDEDGQDTVRRPLQIRNHDD